MLNEKLDSLVRELNDESQAIVVTEGSTQAAPPSPEAKKSSRGGSFNPSPVPRIFKSKEQLMLRANSLKKALRQIIEQAEKGAEPWEGRRGLWCKKPAGCKASPRPFHIPQQAPFCDGLWLVDSVLYWRVDTAYCKAVCFLGSSLAAGNARRVNSPGALGPALG